MVFESKSCDESPYFREIARIYGTEHHEFELNRDSEIVSAIEDFAFYSDEPGADAGALPVWFLSKMSRREVTVALSGEGGDELFGGYLTYRADALAATCAPKPAPLRREAGTRRRTLCCPLPTIRSDSEYKPKARSSKARCCIPTKPISSGTAHFSQAQRAAVAPALPLT